MKCDIIIPVWNQLDLTRDCVDSILRNTATPYRLILIDNASDALTKEYLEAIKEKAGLDVALIRNEENLGFIKAANQGLKMSRSPYICIMNNDIIVAPGWLEKMIDFAESHKDVGLINPRCDGHLSASIDDYAKSLEKYKGEYMEMNQCQGFAMLVKRELIDKIGYLNEAFGIGGYDDTDYSMRAHMAGYRSVAIYDAYVYHRQHASFNKAGNREEWVKRNQKIYYDKWGKHLRLALAFSMDDPDRKRISNMVEYAYGLAREWSWVHIWVNFKGDTKNLENVIASTMKEKDLPPHQNIRINYFNLPRALFNLMIDGKLLERARKRMKDKRFDAIITGDGKVRRSILPFARMTGVASINQPFDEPGTDWLNKGRLTAEEIKRQRGANGTSSV